MSDSEHAGEKKEEQPSSASSPLVSQTAVASVINILPETPGKKACRVCRDIDKTGKHYGAWSCGACGDFFRKKVKQKKEIGECTSSGNCEITPENRNLCEPCRYDACLKAGMQRDEVGKRSSARATPKGETRPEQDLNTSNGSEVETLKKYVAALQVENAGHKDRIDELESTVRELAALKSKGSEGEKLMADIQVENAELKKTVHELAGRLAVLESKGSEGEKLMADIQVENAELKKTVHEQAGRLAALESKVDTLTAGGDYSVHPSDKS